MELVDNFSKKKRSIESNLKSRFFKIQESRLRGAFSDPIISTSVTFIVLTIIIVFLTIPYFKDDPTEYFRSILIEAHGMLFDVAIIGILLYWLNKRGEKRIRINRYREEIEDIRLWKSEEANFKILGNIKRLLRENVRKLDLHQCYLKNVNLSGAELYESNLNSADLSFSILSETDFSDGKLNYLNLEGATLNKTNFQGASLNAACLISVRGIKTNFKNGLLIKADFGKAFLMEPDFSGSDLSGANFEAANLYMANFTGTTGLSAEQFQNIKHLNRPIMDENLYKEILEQCPNLTIRVS
ncbi:MAG: pentapeptide repeat-containing protein [Cytophagaceae bacterium]